MDVLNSILVFFTGPLNTFAWMYTFLPFAIVGGVFPTIRNGGVQFRHFGHAMKNTVGKIFQKQEAGEGAVTPRQAVTTALSATVGTGNIVGTSQATAMGGYGAVFWLWLAALFGMCTKYSEIVLDIKYRERRQGGLGRRPHVLYFQRPGQELEMAGGPFRYLCHSGFLRYWKYVSG